MGLWEKLTGEFIDVIDWLDDSNNTLVYRFDRLNNEIKYGAMLTVRESQVAVFVNEGQIADVFPPGLYQLETNNLPVLTTLQSWPAGFESPFKAEVYFVSTKQFTNLKWGTKNPIMLRDPEFGALRLRAFGTYSIRIADAVRFLQEIAGTDHYFTTQEITDQLRDLIVSRFANVIGKSNIPILDLAANYNDLGEFLTAGISPEFKDYGLGLTKLLVENISLPEEVEKAMDAKTSMGIIGDLSKYVQLEGAQSMRIAAANPNGGAGDGVGLGMGIAMASRLGASLTLDPSISHEKHSSPSANTPPPLPNSARFYTGTNGKQQGPFTLSELANQMSQGVINGESLVWSQGMVQWRPITDIESLSHLLASQPPALPKS